MLKRIFLWVLDKLSADLYELKEDMKARVLRGERRLPNTRGCKGRVYERINQEDAKQTFQSAVAEGKVALVGIKVIRKNGDVEVIRSTEE